MEKGLAEINAVAGVRGSFICDNRGQVIVSATPVDLDATVLKSIGERAVQVLVALETAGEATREMDFMYDQVRLIVRDLTSAVLIVLCQPQVDVAMLRLTLNVVAARLKGHRQLATRATTREITQNKVDQVSRNLLETFEEL